MATARVTLPGFVLNRPPRLPFIADDFNRADGPVGAPALGTYVAPWEEIDGRGFVISDGTRARAAYGTTSTATNVRILQQLNTSDFYIEAVLGAPGTLGASAMPDPGFIARYSSTADYLRLEFNSTEGFRLRNVGGGGTNTVLHASGLTGWTEGEILSLRLVGDQARYSYKGQAFTVTVPHNLTGTKAGLLSKSSSTLFGGTFDSFKIEVGEHIPA